MITLFLTCRARQHVGYSLLPPLACLPNPQMEEVAEAEAALIKREVAVEAARRAAAEDAAAAKAATEQLAAQRSATEDADSGAAAQSSLGNVIMPCSFSPSVCRCCA